MKPINKKYIKIYKDTPSIPKNNKTRDEYAADQACQIMEEMGADVVGMNCMRGPEMTMQILEKVRMKVSCHVSGLPVPYRTTKEEPCFINISDVDCNCIPNDNAFPVALDNLYCNRFEMAKFARDCAEKNINFIGSCCGTEAHHIREMAVALGRKPISKKYMPDMKKHFHFGDNENLKDVNTKYDY